MARSGGKQYALECRLLRDDLTLCTHFDWSSALTWSMALSVLAHNLTRVINILGTRPLIAAIRA